MRRVPSRLLFAAFVLSLGSLTAEGALAEPGFRHAGFRHGGGVRHPGIGFRGHWLRPRHEATGHSHGVRHAPAFRRHGRDFHRSGFRGHGFFPHRSSILPYWDRGDDLTLPFLEPEDIPPHRILTGIPSVADLPVSTGIRSAPAAAPIVYVIGSGNRSLRHRGGAKIVTKEQGETETGNEGADTGPRIIHLDAPRPR
jgi:hypothetical protein